MNLVDIEIPKAEDRHFWYRFFEILPGTLSLLTILAPAILSFISPLVAAYTITLYMIVWFLRSMTMSARTLQCYRIMKQHKSMDWDELIHDVVGRGTSKPNAEYKWHLANLEAYNELYKNDDLDDTNIVQAIVMPFHREGREILQPSLDALAAAEYDMKKVIIVLTAEERAGPEAGILAHELADEYKEVFRHVIATVHPGNLPDELKGKGPNANWGMHALQRYVEKLGIPLSRVVVTSLDCDHRIDPKYLASLTYFYLVCPDRMHTSFQPISMFTNNIWDVPAPMRVIATGNSFWNMIVSTRQHILRNFASHAQSLEAMVATNFYTSRSVVEDGHQYWRSYFRFDGNHEVFPIFTPIYQDAVMAGSFWKSFKEQSVQMRRWAYGASDIAYVAYTGFFKKNSIPKMDILTKWLRLVEGHVSWATSAILLLFAALVPVYINPAAKETVVANQLPIIASHIQQVALIGIVTTMYLSIKLLPPRPARYRKWRYIPMTFQWFLMPVVTIVFASSAALYSQTRLMFGRYMDVFNATIKVVKK
jgi:hypothetical protein